MRGYIIVIISLFSIIAIAFGETTCETERENPGPDRDVQCDEDGFYKPLQCTTGAKKKCACYNKEEPVTSPSEDLKACSCPLALDESRKNNEPQGDCTKAPKCTKEGKFKSKQCCQETGKCRCVDPNTGEVTREPTSDVNCP